MAVSEFIRSPKVGLESQKLLGRLGASAASEILPAAGSEFLAMFIKLSFTFLSKSNARFA